MSIPALFLDRDGTLVRDNGYVHKLEDFELQKGVINGLKFALEKGFKLFVVSNQGGIALKKFSLKQMINFNRKLTNELLDNGIKIIEIKCCIHHPKALDKEMRCCDCRKPSPKMILDLCYKYNIDINKSYFVGNTNVDIKTGENAGCQSILIEEGKFYETLRNKL